MQNTITLRQDQLGDWWVWLGDSPKFDPTRLKWFHPRRGWMYEGRWNDKIHGPYATARAAFDDTLSMRGAP
jgi:hypothetical protein